MMDAAAEAVAAGAVDAAAEVVAQRLPRQANSVESMRLAGAYAFQGV